ncbi:unnamed protein product [Lampetra fluviatilis]
MPSGRGADATGIAGRRATRLQPGTTWTDVTARAHVVGEARCVFCGRSTATRHCLEAGEGGRVAALRG